MRLLLVSMLLPLCACSVLRGAGDLPLAAHAEAVADIAAENTKYIAADPALTDAQKANRVQRNAETTEFAKKLAAAK